MDGKYKPLPVHRLGDRIWQGYSNLLNLYIKWERGELRWIDPTTMRHILTYEDMRERADAALEPAPMPRKPVLKPPDPASVNWKGGTSGFAINRWLATSSTSLRLTGNCSDWSELGLGEDGVQGLVGVAAPQAPCAEQGSQNALGVAPFR